MEASCYVDGAWVEVEKRFEVFDPATGALVGTAADAGPEVATAAIDAAVSNVAAVQPLTLLLHLPCCYRRCYSTRSWFRHRCRCGHGREVAQAGEDGGGEQGGPSQP